MTDGQEIYIVKRCVDGNSIGKEMYIKETYNNKFKKPIKLEFFNNYKYLSDAYNPPIISFYYAKDSIIENYLESNSKPFHADEALGYNKIVYELSHNRVKKATAFLNGSIVPGIYEDIIDVPTFYYSGCDGDTGQFSYFNRRKVAQNKENDSLSILFCGKLMKLTQTVTKNEKPVIHKYKKADLRIADKLKEIIIGTDADFSLQLTDLSFKGNNLELASISKLILRIHSPAKTFGNKPDEGKYYCFKVDYYFNKDGDILFFYVSAEPK